MISLFIFSSSVRGINYGLGTYISELTNELLKFRDIKIYHIYYNSPKVKEISLSVKSDNLTTIYFPFSGFSTGSQLHKIKYSSRIVEYLSPIMKESQNVIIQVNYSSSLPIIKEIKKRFPFPVLRVIHSANWQFFTNGNKQKFQNDWNDRGLNHVDYFEELYEENELYELADHIVSVTDYMKSYIIDFLKLDPKKISVIRNGLDFSKFKIPAVKDRYLIKKQLGFRQTDKIILFVGRLDQGKGLKFLLHAFNLVFIENKNIKLIIIGEDSGNESIRMYLSQLKKSWSNVIFTGFLSRSDLKNFYQIADIGIIPSIYDHCPYTALEMAGYGIPLIISDTEGLNEMFNEEEAIYLNPITDEDGNISFDKLEISNAILTLLNDAKKRKKIQNKYSELIKSKFSGTRMGNEMYSVFRKMTYNGENNGNTQNSSLNKVERQNNKMNL